MFCPNDNEKLEKALFHNVEVDYCPKCLGIWFDNDELRMAKDDKDKDLNWMDFDLWRDKLSFNVSRSIKHCPICRVGLQEVKYDSSKVKVDFCKMCQGVWLDRGEFKQIINYLKQKSDYEILHRYTKDLVLEAWEVFSGPETLREEVADVLTLIKLFNYKFVTQYPFLNSLIENSQK
jgi:Zn-finger nucleic acid-binding protein